MNEIVVGDLLTIENIKYIVIDKIKYVDEDYIFVNKMTDKEDNTSNYYVMKLINENVKIIKDKELLEKLLPVFSDNVQIMVNRVFE